MIPEFCFHTSENLRNRLRDICGSWTTWESFRGFQKGFEEFKGVSVGFRKFQEDASGAPRVIPKIVPWGFGKIFGGLRRV